MSPSTTIGASLGHLSLGKGSIRNLKPKLGMPDNLFLIQSNGLKTKRSNNEKKSADSKFSNFVQELKGTEKKKIQDFTF